MYRLKRRAKNLIRFYVKHGIRKFASILLVICPFISVMCYANCGDIDEAFFVSLVIVLLSYALKAASFLLNVGKDFPVPYKRFTREDEYDGISVNKEDVNDMVSYVCDVENFLEREGLM